MDGRGRKLLNMALNKISRPESSTSSASPSLSTPGRDSAPLSPILARSHFSPPPLLAEPSFTKATPLLLHTTLGQQDVQDDVLNEGFLTRDFDDQVEDQAQDESFPESPIKGNLIKGRQKPKCVEAVGCFKEEKRVTVRSKGLMQRHVNDLSLHLLKAENTEAVRSKIKGFAGVMSIGDKTMFVAEGEIGRKCVEHDGFFKHLVSRKKAKQIQPNMNASMLAMVKTLYIKIQIKLLVRAPPIMLKGFRYMKMMA